MVQKGRDERSHISPAPNTPLPQVDDAQNAAGHPPAAPELAHALVTQKSRSHVQSHENHANSHESHAKSHASHAKSHESHDSKAASAAVGPTGRCEILQVALAGGPRALS